MSQHSADSFEIIAPGLLSCTWNEAEALGSAVWLWMHSSSHRNLPLHTLSSLLLPAIQRRQFILVAEAGRPVFYLAWANLSEAAERRYLGQHPLLMPEADWNSGERIWILDWVAPFGHTRAMRRLVARLFAGHCFRSLDHRGEQRGLRVMEFSGMAVTPAEARAWFAAHPVADVPAPTPDHSREISP